jgi:hypothetical protein
VDICARRLIEMRAAATGIRARHGDGSGLAADLDRWADEWQEFAQHHHQRLVASGGRWVLQGNLTNPYVTIREGRVIHAHERIEVVEVRPAADPDR